MRSKIAQRILDKTPQNIKDKARSFANLLLSDACPTCGKRADEENFCSNSYHLPHFEVTSEFEKEAEEKFSKKIENTMNNLDNFETIYLQSQTILVDKGAEIKEGDYCYQTELPKLLEVCKNRESGWMRERGFYKIIAATPKIEGLPLLSLPDDEVDELAKEITSKKEYRNIFGVTAGLKLGYAAAKQNTFTKEDMIGYKNFYLKQDIEWFDNTEQGDVFIKRNGDKITEKELLQLYLNQKHKAQFIPEMEEVRGWNNGMIVHTGVFQPKVIEGVIQGRWI